MQSSMSRKIKLVDLMQFHQKYFSKFVVNTKVSDLRKIRSVCFSLTHLKINKRLSLSVSAKHHFGCEEHSLHLLIEGVSIQSQETQHMLEISSGIAIEDRLFTQRVGQYVPHAAESEENQSWSFMQIIAFVYQFIKKLIIKSKNAAGQVLNVIQVKG